MKGILFALGELIIAALLVGLVFMSLLYQPTWIWIAAAVVMVGAFVSIISLAKERTARAWLVVLIDPLSYTGYLVVLTFSTNTPSWPALLSAVAFYSAGVVLLAVHQLMNAKRR